MPPQHLILTPVAPAGATLDSALYGATYRALGLQGGQQLVRMDFGPTYAAEFDRVVAAAVRGEDASMTATASRGGLSSAGGVLTLHGETGGTPPERVSWTLGPDAAAQLQAWIQGGRQGGAPATAEAGQLG